MPATMSDQPTPERRVTVAEAAATLGVSKETIRRMVREGKLDADRVETRRGTPAYRVALPPAGVASSHPVSERPEPGVEAQPRVQAPDAGLIPAAAVTQIISPLVAQLVDQAETIGRLRAEATFRRAPRRPTTRRTVRRSRASVTGQA